MSLPQPADCTRTARTPTRRANASWCANLNRYPPHKSSMLIHRDQHRIGEGPLRVGPLRLRAEAACEGHLFHLARSILVARLRPNGFARLEAHAYPIDVHRLRTLRPQVHLDARRLRVETRLVLEMFEIEVRAQLAI